MKTQRTCLRCGHEFQSTGPGNRICGSCARINAAVRINEGDLAAQRGAKVNRGAARSGPRQSRKD